MKRLFRFIALTLICMVSLPLRATIMIPLAVEELSQRAELILQGAVESKMCLKDSDGNIITKISFKVSEVWKGNLTTNVFTIIHGGGTVDGLTTIVDGQAEYQIGEEVVAFLRLNERGEGVSIGLAQGKFRVWKDDATGEKFTHNLFHGKPKGTEASSQAALRSAAGKSDRLRLQDLRSRATGGTQ